MEVSRRISLYYRIDHNNDLVPCSPWEIDPYSASSLCVMVIKDRQSWLITREAAHFPVPVEKKDQLTSKIIKYEVWI